MTEEDFERLRQPGAAGVVLRLTQEILGYVAGDLVQLGDQRIVRFYGSAFAEYLAVRGRLDRSACVLVPWRTLELLTPLEVLAAQVEQARS